MLARPKVCEVLGLVGFHFPTVDALSSMRHLVGLTTIWEIEAAKEEINATLPNHGWLESRNLAKCLSKERTKSPRNFMS